MSDYSAELEAARDLARLGGRIALEHYRRGPRTEQKTDGTWVTEADWAVEAQIRLRIARSFPDHNVLGEEEGLSAAGGGPATEGAPTWVIDPIDGTHNYMTGIPIWATLVALQIDGESVVGVAHAPALGESYDGAVGLGARMNDQSIRVNEVGSLNDATVAFASVGRSSPYWRFFNRLVSRSWRNRGFGDFWGHCLVARGAAAVMFEPDLSLWDVAALQPIISEAGGRTTDLTGKPWSVQGPCLTTNGSIHDEVLSLTSD